MGIPRKEYWSGLPFPSPEDLSEPGIKSRSPTLQADALPSSHQTLRYDLNQIPYDYTVEVMNRFKGSDLIECLKHYGQRFGTLYRRWWPEPSPRNAKAKWLSKEALQIAEKREEKGKGERERFIHLNAEFQRISRRDKKALSEQCKEIEENNRMGKTRDLFKKIRDTKGTFQAKMGTIKDRNSVDLTEVEDIKKRWHEYTEELYKKILMTWITMMVWSLT